MPLRNFMTTTASTTRNPALSGGKIGTPVTNLTLLKIMPLMLNDARSQQALMARQAAGFEGTQEQLWETYTESHLHTDSGTPVTQIPDIREGDRLIVDGLTYTIRFAKSQSETTSFGKTMIIFASQDERI